jgi:hypothetical protein
MSATRLPIRPSSAAISTATTVPIFPITRTTASWSCAPGKPGADTVLDGLIIERGNADGPMNQYDRGGGMYNWLGGPTLRNCTFRLNASTYGGAVYNDASDATFHNCTFEDNQAVIGGGVLLCTYNSTTTIGAVPLRAQSGHQRRRRRACTASTPRSTSDQCNLDRERSNERRRIVRGQRHARADCLQQFHVERRHGGLV